MSWILHKHKFILLKNNEKYTNKGPIYYHYLKIYLLNIKVKRNVH